MDELPGGYWDPGGTLHREVELTPLTGRDEESLAGTHGDGAALVTAVLSRCVRRVGAISPVPPEVAAGLLVADRLYLLLRLRAACFGEQVRADVTCPWADCGKRVSLSFSLGDVPVVRSPDPRPAYTAALSDPVLGEVEFRLPTGADQQELAAVAAVDETRALTLLLARCVLRLGGRMAPPELVAALPAAVRTEIEQHLYDAAPRVEQAMDARCAECGRTFEAPFDIHRLLFGELRADAGRLFQEVHYLAFHYHWSEREVLELPRDRRRGYIELLGQTIEVLNNGA